MWIPVQQSWRLNERHYGALQGLNKAETAAQVWRGAGQDLAPQLRHAAAGARARRSALPGSATALRRPRAGRVPAHRVPARIPWRAFCRTGTRRSRRRSARASGCIIAAHGNSLRALVKYLDDIRTRNRRAQHPDRTPAGVRARRRAQTAAPLLPWRSGNDRCRHARGREPGQIGMKIERAYTIVTCPGRNFVTLKIETDDGSIWSRRRDAQRSRARCRLGLSQRSRDPVPDRPRRRTRSRTPGSTSTAARTGGAGRSRWRDRRGRHGAVGHQGQESPACRCTSCSAGASRHGVMVYGHANGRDHRRDHRRGARAIAQLGYRAIRVQAGVPGPRRRPTGSPRARCTTSRPTRGCPSEEPGRHRAVPAPIRPKLFETLRDALRLRPAPAARRPPPPDARSRRRGWARSSSRIGCSGSRMRRRRRTRRRSG